ncbi:MAG: nicotinamide mononucleotide deamidase-related protein [Planctomycetota bacterium]
MAIPIPKGSPEAPLNQKNVIIVCISREVLEGSVVDRNAAFMAARISGLGLRVRAVIVTDRIEGEMVRALRWALEEKPTFVLTTGGLGPGHDDNTRECLAKALGIELVESEQALSFVESSHRRLLAKGLVEEEQVGPDRRRMALVPKGAKSFENPIGSAPGIEIAAGETSIFLLPGVPAEMQAIFRNHVLPRLMEHGPETLRQKRSIDCEGGDEAALTRTLSTVAKRHPGVDVRTRLMDSPNGSRIQITLEAEHHDPVGLEEMLEMAELDLRSRLGLETEHSG